MCRARSASCLAAIALTAVGLSACSASSRAHRTPDRHAAASSLVMPGASFLALEQRHPREAPGWEHARHDAALGADRPLADVAPLRFVEVRRRELLWTINGRPREVTREVTTTYERRYPRSR